MSKLTLIDTHCHLQMKTFKDALKRIIDDAIGAEIGAIINVGFDIPFPKIVWRML